LHRSVSCATANSTWLGGTANENGGLHERLPYWLNGAVPLAYLLPDNDPATHPPPQTNLAMRCAAVDADDARAGVFTARRILADEPDADVLETQPRAEAVRSATSQPSRTCAVHEHVAGTRDLTYSLRHEVKQMLNYILDHQVRASARCHLLSWC
jgi:hypothetical protein